MDYQQRNGDDNYSVLILNQPMNSLSLTSSTISILDPTLKTTSILKSKESTIHIKDLGNRIKSLPKQFDQQEKEIEYENTSQSMPIRIKQEARPLGTCVRKCVQCRQLKHILLAECTVCFRMVDIDLKDCKCQTIINRNIIDHFICSICNSELTLDGYILCANRTCQTILSGMMHKDNITDTHKKPFPSATLTNISYPKLTYRTVAIQVNTLNNLPPLQRFLSTIINDENKEKSSLSWSQCDINQAILLSSDPSNRSHLSINSSIDTTFNNIPMNLTVGFNSNQPKKLSSKSEDELQQSQTHILTNTIDTTENNTSKCHETPKSPRCLAIMDSRKRRDRLSTLVKLQANTTCQTELSCLRHIDKMIKCEEISSVTTIQTNDPTKIERQIHVNTIKDQLNDFCQTGVERDVTNDVMNEAKILQALIDRDSQRWSEFIDQLINERSQFSPSENGQQLLDTIERLHTNGKLNTLTSGQIQRKVRYAMSRFKHLDEHSHFRNNLKTIKTNSSGTESKRNTDCDGRIDLSVTVRQIDKHHHHSQSGTSSDQNWKPYVDRLFEQGYSANEIQRLLHQAAETTMQMDNQRLQDVFNYINTKANIHKSKTTPSRSTSSATSNKSKITSTEQFQSTHLFQPNKPNETRSSNDAIMTLSSSSVPERKETSQESSSPFHDVLPNNNIMQSSTIKSDTVQIESTDETSMINLIEGEQELNSSIHSSSHQQSEDRQRSQTTFSSDDNQSPGRTDIPIHKGESQITRPSKEKDIFTSKDKSNQIQEIVESKTSQSSTTPNSHHRKSSSTIDTTLSKKSNDTSSTYLEEKCIDALRSVHDTLENIENSNTHVNIQSANINSEINNLINTFQSHLDKPKDNDHDKIEILITRCIESLNKQKNTFGSQLEKYDVQQLDEKISNTLNLLQEYKKITVPNKINIEDSPFNRHVSNMTHVLPTASTSSQQVENSVEQSIKSSSHSISSSSKIQQQQAMTKDYQETAGLIKCRRIPYTSSNEKRSTDTLKQVLISSTEDILPNSKDLNEQQIESQTDFHSVSNKSSKTTNDLHNTQSQLQRFDSSSSKMSDNIANKSDILSISPSLSETDLKDKRIEPIQPINNRSKSSIPHEQHSTNVPETITGSQNTLAEQNIIKFEEGHPVSVILPDEDRSTIDEPFQLIQTKIFKKNSPTSSRQTLNSGSQLLPSSDEKNNEHDRKGSSKLLHDSSDTSEESSSATNLHTDYLDQDNQSLYSVNDGELQSVITPSSSTSSIDLSQQSDSLQHHDDIKPSEQLVIDDSSKSEDQYETPEKQFDSSNDKNYSPEFASEHMRSPKTDFDTVPETSTESSRVYDQEKEKRTTSISSSPSQENKDQSIEKTSHSEQTHRETIDKHASTSRISNNHNDIHKRQIPIDVENSQVSDAIQSHSSLIHLNDQEESVSSKGSISSNNIMLDVHENSSTKVSSTDSKDHDIYATPSENNDNKKSSREDLNITVNDVIHTPVILSPKHSLAQILAKTILSPSRSIKIEKNKYQKLTTPPSFPVEGTAPAVTDTSKEKEFKDNKSDKKPRSLIEEQSESTTPTVKTSATDKNGKDERANKSLSATQKLPIDDNNKSKENLEHRGLQYNHDSQTEHILNSPVLSDTSNQESNSVDDATRGAPLPSRNTKTKNIRNKDNPSEKTPLAQSTKSSRSNMPTEDTQMVSASTSPAYVTPPTPNNDTGMKTKGQIEKQDQSISVHSDSSHVLSMNGLDGENQSDKTPIESIRNKETSSNESVLDIDPENIGTPEHSSTEYETSEENPSAHSSFQSEKSHQNEDYQPRKKTSLKIESLIKLLPSPPDVQSMADVDSETKDNHDQISPSHSIDHEHNDKDQLDDQQTSKNGETISSIIIKNELVKSINTVIIPSSATTVDLREQYQRSRISSPKNKNEKLISDNREAVTSEDTQEPISKSSFNLTHLTDVIRKKSRDIEESLLDNDLHHTDSKQQSSSTNTLTLINGPTSSVPKLLPKRSSFKKSSTTAHSIKPTTILSITDVTTSSSETMPTNHLPSTHSRISNQEQIISLKKTTRRIDSKDKFIVTQKSLPKRNVLKKTLRPSENRSLTSSNQKQKSLKTSKKSFVNRSLLTNSELTYDTEAGSETWLKSHEDISQVLIIDEQNKKKSSVDKQQQNKKRKDLTNDGSRLKPLNLKTNKDHQAYTIDSSKLPAVEQFGGEHQMKKLIDNSFRRPVIRLPVTQIEKFECGTFGSHFHPSFLVRQLIPLPSIQDHHHVSSPINEITEPFTDRFYSAMSPKENNDDKQAFESIVNWQHQHSITKNEQNKFQYMYLLDTSSTIGNSIRGKQYPILPDEIDMIDDPNACTIVNKWAFADLVNNEREKYHQKSKDNRNTSKNRLNRNKNIQIYLRKRPLTQFEENVFKEVDIISIVDSQTILLHIPSITLDNQVFVKNRKFKCDQTFDEHCSIKNIYQSTFSPLLDSAIHGDKCLCLIGGGKYSGKTTLLRNLIDLFSLDLNRYLSTYDIYIKLLGICHNRIVDILQNYSPIRLIKSQNWNLIPNEEFHIENSQDIDYIICQIKKRRRFIHQLIEINFRQNNQTTTIGSLMIVILASSQYIYTRNLCSHRRKFLINSLNKTILAFKRALLGIRQNPDRIRTAFNNDILTRLIQPYVFDEQAKIFYIGTLNPGHRHRIATKSTLEFARNLRFCLKRINQQYRQRKKFSRMNNNEELDDDDDNTF